MRVLIANPPWYVDGRLGVRAGSRWPHLKREEEEDYMPFPFYLGYAAAVLKQHGIHAIALDAIAEAVAYNEYEYEHFYRKLIDFDPNLILFEVSTPSLKNDLDVIKTVRKFSDAHIAVTGPDFNIMQEKFLLDNKEIDFVLYGEYEYTILELVEHLRDRRDMHGVDGLIFRDRDGKIIKNKRRALCDVNKLPWPERIFFPINNYEDRPGGIAKPSLQMWASRGCPYRCKFCAWPQFMYGGSNYRVRDPKNVVDEMEHFAVKHGFKSMYFDDDTFNIGKERMLQISDEILKRKLKVEWAIMARADTMDYEMLCRMKEAGLKAVKYGVESANQQLLDNISKGLDIVKAKHIIKLTKDLGIKVHLTFTFGLPGETKKTIQETIDLARELDPDSVQFSIMTPFPGTKYHDELMQRGEIVSFNLEDYDGNEKAVIKTKDLDPEDLVVAQKEAYRLWQEHRCNNGLMGRVKDCYKEHGFSYTLNRTMKFVTGKIK